jgi:hypothetical protein
MRRSGFGDFASQSSSGNTCPDPNFPDEPNKRLPFVAFDGLKCPFATGFAALII